MARVPAAVIILLKKYLAALEKDSIHVSRAYLFGSYAQGYFTSVSDIDIALVSDDFTGEPFWDRQRLARTTLSLDYRIDPLPYRLADFSEASLMVREILSTGIQITPN